jgi:hypothetical protein
MVCTNCGATWNSDLVLYEEPEAFTREGGAIVACPVCPDRVHRLAPEERERLVALRQE